MLLWFERHPRIADAAIALGALVMLGAADLIRGGVSALLTTIIFALSAFFWRRMPGLGLAVAWVGALVQISTVDGLLAGDLLILAAVFATGLAQNPAVRWAGLASSVLGGAIAGARLVLFAPSDRAPILDDPFYRGVYFVLASAVIAAALALFWALGVLVRNRRAQSQQRADRQRERILSEARLAQERERALLSREMHDLVGHALAVVIAQSDGARYAKATDPHAETTALATINRAARAALDDVHELLTVLREPGDGARMNSKIADLDLLVSTVQQAGLDVVVTESGARVPLSAAHELALFRVLQESLTNALKHGGRGTHVDVTLDWQSESIRFGVLTTESSRPTSHPTTANPGNELGVEAEAENTTEHRAGHGLIGMKERMRLLDGSVTAVPRTDLPGFQVVAVLPYRSNVFSTPGDAG
ncbi:sensor histidine kinase [Subtercola frigoramans]|uniref:histidine kinase n=1 Tax=Subtercola frigoramans TaxID=120298 RepID=A0ABS2L3G7_9MICO|nr:histidine kinase [Subtercola frigoramans]MBM7471644.1 signal transduction histidine kinase [Subtercola frigoramans]